MPILARSRLGLVARALLAAAAAAIGARCGTATEGTDTDPAGAGGTDTRDGAAGGAAGAGQGGAGADAAPAGGGGTDASDAGEAGAEVLPDGPSDDHDAGAAGTDGAEASGGTGGGGAGGAAGSDGGDGPDAPGPCQNGVQDGSESDVDCGGGACPGCGNGKKCVQNGDCWSGSCIGGACGGCPADMAPVPAPGGTTTCIDKTEVTAAKYQAFLDSSPSPSGQAAWCAWNADFAPATYGNGCAPGTNDPKGAPYRPVVCVDWCDAVRYCAWAGKRLCAKPGGGQPSFYGWTDPKQSEWFGACSAGGTKAFPYGATFDPKACNGWDYGLQHALPVKTAAGCTGGVADLWDMSGNVSELEFSCDTWSGGSDWCRLRGGSYMVAGEKYMRCDGDYFVNRAATYATVGFRCCGG